MHGDSRNIADRLHIPDLAKQLFLREYVIRILCKEGEQIKLLRRKRPLLAIDPDAARRLINLDAAHLNDVILLHIAVYQALIPCQVCFHTRYQLTRAEWLRHVIIRSKSESTDLVNVILFS